MNILEKPGSDLNTLVIYASLLSSIEEKMNRGANFSFIIWKSSSRELSALEQKLQKQ